MLKHRMETHESERRRDCIRGWWERYGLIIAAIGGTLAISGSCWAFVLRQADPHIDSRFDLKSIAINARLDSQDKKISVNTDKQNLIFEMLSQHITTGEMMRASKAYRFKKYGTIDKE